ncbi:TerD family protein [Spirillospora sp. CA-294931]|uniref:TerD family protein n=1 Tax=Spirillospora sp. CA-294931 TaxID=3240042 RepID=UPI003D8BF5CD
MTIQLAKGGNAAFEGRAITIAVTAGQPVDVSAALLGPERKVRADHDLVFFNHPAQDGVALSGSSVTADLDRLPAEITTVAVLASVDADRPDATFDAATTPSATVTGSASGPIGFTPPPLTEGETVVVLVELYRRGEGWKVRAVGQGWASGLAGLAADFGVAVEEPVPAPAPPVQTAPRKITLEKAGRATISLDKGDPAAVVTATLEWDGGSDLRREMGADLDLYALFVPAEKAGKGRFGKRGGGRATDGAVYYRDLGSLTSPPYVQHAGDSTEPGRETVRIARPDQQGYVLICAYSAIGNGHGSFRSFGARAVVTDGRGSAVNVPLFHDNSESYWVAIALVDFTAPDGVEIRHVETYGASHAEERPVLYADGTFEMDKGPAEFKDDFEDF